MIEKQKTVLLMMMYRQAAMHGTMRRPSKGRHAHSTQAGGSQQEYCCPGRWGQLKNFSWLCLCLSFCPCFFVFVFLFVFVFVLAGGKDILILLFVTQKPPLGDYQRKDNWMKNRTSQIFLYFGVLLRHHLSTFENQITSC